MAEVVVVGSANLDLVVRTEVRPAPGETVLGSHFEEFVGGKGLNQAIASARLATTALVAAVGDDEAGNRLLQYAHRRAVDVRHVQSVDAPTGRAVIVVTPDGENSIIVVAGANMVLAPEDINAALDNLKPQVVVIQREINEESTLATITWAENNNARLIVNPSPPVLAEFAWFATADPLIVNLHEARLFAGDETLGPEEAAAILAKDVRSVLVTSGAEGVWVADRDGANFVASVPVGRVEDTTGAGDEFAGAVAATLAHGGTLIAASQAGAAAASRLVGKPRQDR